MNTSFKFSYAILLLCLLAATGAIAQKEGRQKIDSLLKDLPRQKEDSGKAEILNELSYCYYAVNPDTGIIYGKEGLELATQLHWQNGIARANLALGYNYLRRSDNPAALAYFQQSMQLYEAAGNKKGIASAMSCVGLVYLSGANYSKALSWFLKALAIQEEIGNKDGMAMVCDNIGDTYRGQKNYEQALLYTFRSLHLDEEIGKKTGIAIALQGIGEIYECQGNYRQAVAYMLRAMKINEELGNRLRIAWAHTYIGQAYVSMAMAGTGILSRRAVIDTAAVYLRKGVELGLQIQALDVLQVCYRNLADAYKISNDYKTALWYYRAYTTIHDSVFSQENNERIVRVEYENVRFYDSLKAAQSARISRIELAQQRSITYGGFAVIFILACFTVFIFRERKRSDKLLLNILPVQVAAELKAKGSAPARNFDNVTILFTDFVNFTEASEMMSPQALIDELHTCFKAFDEIAIRYGIEKIKTIGDAYLAVAGLPASDTLHAVHCVQAALDIQEFMRRRNADPACKTFRIRVGIHSGSVIAGVVGIRKFSYDIWGDAVNIAADLEEQSKPGEINISQATYDLVKDVFHCTGSGMLTTEAGQVNTYFVSPPTGS